jgi:hypothetical protein
MRLDERRRGSPCQKLLQRRSHGRSVEWRPARKLSWTDHDAVLGSAQRLQEARLVGCGVAHEGAGHAVGVRQPAEQARGVGETQVRATIEGDERSVRYQPQKIPRIGRVVDDRVPRTRQHQERHRSRLEEAGREHRGRSRDHDGDAHARIPKLAVEGDQLGRQPAQREADHADAFCVDALGLRSPEQGVDHEAHVCGLVGQVRDVGSAPEARSARKLHGGHREAATGEVSQQAAVLVGVTAEAMAVHQQREPLISRLRKPDGRR